MTVEAIIKDRWHNHPGLNPTPLDPSMPLENPFSCRNICLSHLPSTTFRDNNNVLVENLSLSLSLFPLLSFSLIISLPRCLSPSLSLSLVVSCPHYLFPSLSPSLIVSLPHCLSPSLSLSLVSRPLSLVVSRPLSLIVSLPRCLSPSLSLALIISLPRCLSPELEDMDAEDVASDKFVESLASTQSDIQSGAENVINTSSSQFMSLKLVGDNIDKNVTPRYQRSDQIPSHAYM